MKSEILNRDHPRFPVMLKEISGSPEKIHVRGVLPDAPAIAVVGTRKPTAAGSSFAFSLAKRLAEEGFVIVSGLAFGIDASAHEGALKAGGATVAVLGHGLHTIYPSSHQNLASRIISLSGTVVSEYPEGTPSLPHRFLERNRIISGLSLGVVIIEAPERSGALATARFAAEQGREVFVTPGPAGHPNYAGSHSLLRNGARIAQSAEEILEDLKSLPLWQETESNLVKIIGKSESASRNESANETLILQIIKREPLGMGVDNIAISTKLEPRAVYETLTFLTVAGKVKEERGLFFLKVK